MKATIKTTAKEFQAMVELQTQLMRSKRAAEDNADYDKAEVNKKTLAEMDAQYFDFLPTQAVSYWIGYRSYYEEVVKIGKGYYLRGEKMTKSRGYRSITEIEKVTDKMKADMLADSYYY